MNARKFLLATLAYVAVTFVIAILQHLVLFKDVYEQLAIYTRKEPLIHLGLLSMLLQGMVLAYAYPRFGRGGDPWRDGLAFGLLAGVLMGSLGVLAEAGKQNVTSLSTWIVLEGSYFVVQFTLAGLAIALVYGRRAATAT